MTRLLHGEKGLHAAQNATGILYGKDTLNLSANEIIEATDDSTLIGLDSELVIGHLLTDLLQRIGAVKSKGVLCIFLLTHSFLLSRNICVFVAAEARRLIKGGGVNLNNRRVTSDSQRISEENLIDAKVLIIRIGKRNNFVVEAK